MHASMSGRQVQPDIGKGRRTVRITPGGESTVGLWEILLVGKGMRKEDGEGGRRNQGVEGAVSDRVSEESRKEENDERGKASKVGKEINQEKRVQWEEMKRTYENAKEVGGT